MSRKIDTRYDSPLLTRSSVNKVEALTVESMPWEKEILPWPQTESSLPNPIPLREDKKRELWSSYCGFLGFKKRNEMAATEPSQEEQGKFS